jgi:hypothetical protein
VSLTDTLEIVSKAIYPYAPAGMAYGSTVPVVLGFKAKPPLQWSINSGSLPPGLMLDAARGVIHGTTFTSDIGNTYSFSVKVTDATGLAAIGEKTSISVDTALTSVKQLLKTPLTCELKQNYPNPFNPSTIISWQLASESFVTVKVYNMLGSEVATLVSELQSAGNHSAVFNALQTTGRKGAFAAGVYYYRIQAGNFTDTKKLVLLK